MQETQEMWVQSLGWEEPLESEMATHSRAPAKSERTLALESENKNTACLGPLTACLWASLSSSANERVELDHLIKSNSVNEHSTIQQFSYWAADFLVTSDYKHLMRL